MINQINLKEFENIYNQTYKHIQKYVVCKCSNIDDVNDIIQEVYYQFYKSLTKKEYLAIENIQQYLIGIAKNQIKRYYGILYKLKTISLFQEKEDLQLIDTVADNIDISNLVINKVSIDNIWNFLKKKKPIIMKIFYLYYELDMKIKDIAVELNVNESFIKNTIYRTLKELSLIFKEEKNV